MEHNQDATVYPNLAYVVQSVPKAVKKEQKTHTLEETKFDV